MMHELLEILRMKLGVCYYPEHWARERWRDDAGRMVAMGIGLVRIGEFAWALIEPREGEFDWGWLDEAVTTLADAGLQIVLGTPTAAPPRWLTEAHPEVLPVDAQGRVKPAGSRRHVDFSSSAYFEASHRIVEAMARRYGAHPAVVAWQTDNEYGCHDTIASYSPAALRRFRAWLQTKYGSVDELNRRWGNVFWSMTVDRFDQVGLPVGLPANANPAHALDFRRFASDEVLRFNRMQVDLLRAQSPGRPVLHNFMSFHGEFDVHAMGRDLDLATWDSYPLGHTDSVSFIAEADKLRWAQTGHPDIAAFHHDLYRNVGRGRFGVMEQQAGPVNWAAWNPAPLPGQVRAWTWAAFAHGAQFVSYFRWRQLPWGQEQMHSGLLGSDDQVDAGGHEAAQVSAEIAAVQQAIGPTATPRAPVALLFDYTSHWMAEIDRHGADFHSFGQAFAWYGAARRLGLDVDIVSPTAALEGALDGRALVLLPALLLADEALAEYLAACGAQLVIGPRSGSKTTDFRIPEGLAPGPLATLAGLRVRAVESLRPGLVHDVEGPRLAGQASGWREQVEAAAGTVVLARYADGHPALLRHERTRYVTGGFDPALLQAVLAEAASAAALGVQAMPEGLRLRRCGALQFAFHSGPGTARVPAPPGAHFVLGGPLLAAAGVAAWRVA
jgi:beta-galactosidase